MKRHTSLLLILTNLAGIFCIDRVFGMWFPAYPAYLNKKQYSWESYATNYRNYFDATRTGPDGKIYYTIDRSHEAGERKYESATFEPDSIQIMAIGDSFTAGQGVKLEDTYPKRLERIKSRRRVYGINLGEAGADVLDVFNELNEAESRSHYHPSLIVYGYVLNDPPAEPDDPSRFSWAAEIATATTRSDSGLAWDLNNLRVPIIREMRSPTLAWLGGHSRIADFVIGLYERDRLAQSTLSYYRDLHDPAKNPRGLETTFAKIEAMRKIAGKEKSRFLVMIFPIFYHVGGDDYPLAGVHSFLARRLREMGVDALDLLPAYQGYRDKDLWVHPVDQHPNDLAQRIAADQLEGWMRKNTSILEGAAARPIRRR